MPAPGGRIPCRCDGMARGKSRHRETERRMARRIALMSGPALPGSTETQIADKKDERK